MKVTEVVDDVKKFKPIELNIKIETPEELAAFAVLTCTGADFKDQFEGIEGRVFYTDGKDSIFINHTFVANFVDKMFPVEIFRKYIQEVEIN
jgi:hypothetical protein